MNKQGFQIWPDQKLNPRTDIHQLCDLEQVVYTLSTLVTSSVPQEHQYIYLKMLMKGFEITCPEPWQSPWNTEGLNKGLLFYYIPGVWL